MPRAPGPVEPAHTAVSRQAEYVSLAETILANWGSSLPAALLFTSPTDGSGKTMTVARLAVLLAERLPGVVAVDANLHGPGLTHRFGIEAECGVVEAIRGEIPWREALWRTPLETLSLLPVGIGSNEEELAVEADELDFGPLLEALRWRYRLVLVDAPSLQYPEVAPLARACDGAYLVVKLGRSPRRATRSAARILERQGVRICGTIVRGGER